LVLGEVGLRVAGVTYPVFDDFDAARGVRLRPGKEGWYDGEGRAYLKINQLGYRDVEHAVVKPPGTFRVAVLGDSFVEARQVDIKDTFWSVLGDRLRACPALRGRPVEVLAFGTGGYATTEELLTWRKDVRAFSPDWVTLAFFAGNDVQDNSRALNTKASWRITGPTHSLASDGTLVPEPFHSSFSSRLLYEGVHHFRLLELMGRARRNWSARQVQQHVADGPSMTAAEGLFTSPKDPAWENAWKITEALIRRLGDEVKATGARFSVMNLTLAEQVSPDKAALQALAERYGEKDLFYVDRRIGAVGRRYGFWVTPLAERMQKAAVDNHAYFHGFANRAMGTGHWNESGHRMAGEILASDICASLSTR
jgi:hypothetical protein